MRSMMSCKEVSALVSRSREERVSVLERMKIRLHLTVCEACSRFERQVRFMDRAMKDYVRKEPERGWEGPGLLREARERIRQALRDGKNQ